MFPAIMLLMVGILGLLPFVANTYLLQTLTPESVLVYTAIVYSAAIFAFYILHREHVDDAFKVLNIKIVSILVLTGLLGVFIPNMVYVYIMKHHMDEVITFMKHHFPYLVMGSGFILLVVGSMLWKRTLSK